MVKRRQTVLREQQRRTPPRISTPTVRLTGDTRPAVPTVTQPSVPTVRLTGDTVARQPDRPISTLRTTTPTRDVPIVSLTGQTTPTRDQPVVELTGSRFAAPPLAPEDRSMFAAADIQQQQAVSRLAQPPTTAFAGGDVPLVQLTGETGRDVPLNYGTLTDQFVGSEQATLGVTYQALADWGLLTGEEMGFLGVQPAALPAWALGMQDLGILQNNLAEAGVDPNAVWEIYEQTTINGRDYAVLKDYSDETGLDGGGYTAYDGDDGGDGGYTYRAPAAGYSPYRAPGSFQSGYTSGLINWRIGFS